MKIIFAQGNPEPDYANTRHNIGFSVLNVITDPLTLKWSYNAKFNSYIADTTIYGQKILLVKPNTFYNETGNSIRKIVDFYKINPVDDLLVVHDDLALDFGTIRIRTTGSDGGNNGIKSINSHLNSHYSRIKIGTNYELPTKMADDADFVTSKFSASEKKQLSEKIIPQVIDLIHKFFSNNLEITSHKLI